MEIAFAVVARPVYIPGLYIDASLENLSHISMYPPHESGFFPSNIESTYHVRTEADA